MKKLFPALAVTATAVFSSVLSSCVGQLERQFPWEESTSDTTSVVPAEGTAARNLILLDFTATWCVNCPQMAAAITELPSRGINMIPVSVHYADEMACDASNSLVEGFGVFSFPTAIFNFDADFSTSISSVDVLKALAEQAFAAVPNGCNVEIRANSHEGVINIEVDIDYLTDGSFSVGAAVLEDGIVAPQIGISEECVHDNVLRTFLQEKYTGVPCGAKKAGDSDKLCFSVTLQPEWNIDALKAVVYILSGEKSPAVCNAKVTRIQ